MIAGPKAIPAPHPLREDIQTERRAGHRARRGRKERDVGLFLPQVAMNRPDVVRETAQAIRVQHAEADRGAGDGGEDRGLRGSHDVRKTAPGRWACLGGKGAPNLHIVPTLPIRQGSEAIRRHRLSAEIHRVEEPVPLRIRQVNVFLDDGGELAKQELTCN